ncbi:hypothetical protein SA3033_06080 [Aggregatibacter actinomycetemcomitans serotype d str. SA3033]|nr:hypothetical protein HMPREF9996_00847 [Aggregatibacter actinomycetemcomitans Y4]KYK80236.1 hypothetical protein SA2876_00795 [Aggregatibacter actinomycetemcomitans serotype e str. SA2876]KYK83675.1 hypothetical protein SA3033_06080 [Aggregatibacter actinomycetemcomitans serotype d str. SA3033]KYK88413.1 hypothetical protein SA2200_04555 [Aggregatibacter actinomycetemcomitans serotype d str. SA2200]KYK91327.1 hypothetical protein SA508_00625 [Aggregatibacter actinomycetemcomitans serotype d s
MQFKCLFVAAPAADSIKDAILIQITHESKGQINVFLKSASENWLKSCKAGKIQRQ